MPQESRWDRILEKLFSSHNLWKFVAGTIILSLTVGALAVSLTSITGSQISLLNLTKVRGIPITVIAITVSMLFFSILTYLNRTRVLFEDFKVDYDYLSTSQRNIESLQREWTVEIPSVDQEASDRIRKAINEQVDEIIETELIKRFQSKIEQDARANNYSELIIRSILRIKSEIDSLESRGNLNLSIGIVATVIGIIMLGAFVFTSNYANLTVYQFVYHFVPRLSLVIFIQVFAFFFLGLYKANMGEVKYYNNELTAVEARLSALVVAIDLDDNQCLAKLVSDLSNIDRNNVVQTITERKPESSTELVGKIFDAISPVLRKK